MKYRPEQCNFPEVSKNHIRYEDENGYVIGLDDIINDLIRRIDELEYTVYELNTRLERHMFDE